MLIALISLLLLGGGGSDGLFDFGMIEEQIESVVTDTNDREFALETWRATEEKHEAYDERIQDWKKQMKDLLADSTVDIAELDAIWDDYFNATRKWHRDMIDARFEMKRNISREEWIKIFTTPQQ